jgi:hypothetical protein
VALVSRLSQWPLAGRCLKICPPRSDNVSPRRAPVVEFGILCVPGDLALKRVCRCEAGKKSSAMRGGTHVADVITATSSIWSANSVPVSRLLVRTFRPAEAQRGSCPTQ